MISALKSIVLINTFYVPFSLHLADISLSTFYVQPVTVSSESVSLK